MDANVRKYEMMMIMRPDLLEKDVEKVFEIVRSHIKESEGTITLEDFWGKRTLAYPIKKQEKGLYAVFYFDMPTKNLKALDAEMRIEGDILRHLIVKTPDDMDVIEYITVLKEQAEKDKANFDKEMEEKKKQEPKPRPMAPKKAPTKRVSDAPVMETARVEKKDDSEIDAHVDRILGDLDNE